MRIAVRVARILLGIIFVFFGSNAFLKLLPMPPMPAGLPLAHFTAILWAFLFYRYRQDFTGLFVQNTQLTTPNHSEERT
jgi:hypothetical protein